MKIRRFLSMVLTATGILGVVLALGSVGYEPANAAPTAPGPSQVLVVNTSNQAVPVTAQGTTTVGGTVTVGNAPGQPVPVTGNVNVSGSVNVTAQGTTTVDGTVNVGNQVSNPVLVRHADGREPFFISYYGIILSGGVTGVSFTNEDPGQRTLVIEVVGSYFDMPTGQTVAMSVGLEGPGATPSYTPPSVEFFMSPTLVGSNMFQANTDRYAATQTIRLYVAPGARISGRVARVAVSNQPVALGSFSFSGYWVNAEGLGE